MSILPPAPQRGHEREPHSAVEIRDEVARLLYEGRKIRAAVPLPKVVPRTPGNLNSNWDMPRAFRSQPGFQIDIGLALISVKKRWDLDVRHEHRLRDRRGDSTEWS
jgi:hypothetical protein